MASALHRGYEARRSTDLLKELLAAGFLIEPWGDGAKLMLPPLPCPAPFDDKARSALANPAETLVS